MNIDDTFSIADTQEELEKLVDGLHEACQRIRQTINIEKYEVRGVTNFALFQRKDIW